MNRLQANLCLLCVSLCWSTEVIIFACIPDNVVPFATTFICNAIASVILAACFCNRIKKEVRRSGKKVFLRCLLLGALNCGYSVLFLYGLKYFDVSTGAFTISITVVVLPVVLITMKKTVGIKTWISVGLVLIGMFVALGNSMVNAPPMGLLIMLCGCIVRAVFIVKLNDYAKEHDPVTLSVFISVVVSVLSFGIWLVLQPATFGAIPWSGTIIASLFIYAYFIVAFAQTLNFFAQRRAAATQATIIYSLEIVFSLIWGAVLPEGLVERAVPSPFQIIGAAMIVVGSIVEIVDYKGTRKVTNDG